MNKLIKHLPNLISVLRVPLAALVVLYYSSNLKYLFLFLFIASDLVDGYIARRFNCCSKLGGVLDPIADKIGVAIIFLYIIFGAGVPLWYLLVFFLRDVVIVLVGSGLKIFNVGKHIEMKARTWGKVVTNLQFVTLVSLVLGINILINVCLVVLLCASVVCLIDYYRYLKNPPLRVGF